MIYTLLPEKDTYITNRIIENKESSTSNVGRAATLDVFKLNNETSSMKSWALLKVLNSLPLNNETFTLTDTLNNEVVFKFVEAEDNITYGSNIIGEDNIKIGLGANPYSKEDLVREITLVINNVNNFTQTGPTGNLSLEILASKSNDTIFLEQTKKGEKGDNKITQSTTSNLLIQKQFGRTEYSNILLKFDLQKFKNDNIANFANSVFSNKSLFKAEIELIDITTGLSKPYDYTLNMFPLSKSFDEGLGKDTILFEDIDTCNFITASFNRQNNEVNVWGIKNFLVENIDYYTQNNNISLTSSFYVKEGDENIKFDITEYVHQSLSDNIEDKGFSIRLSDLDLFNSYSYFVKRLGSRHLLNKNYIPKLNLKINNLGFYLPKNNTSIKRYFNTQDDFFLYNSQNGLLKDISIPEGLTELNLSASLTFNDFSLVKKGISSSGDITKYTNMFGEEKNGIYKFSITDNEVNRYDQFLSQSIESSDKGSIDLDLNWYWFKEGEIPEKRIIKTEKISFNLPENDDLTFKNIISKITINNFDLIANDTIQNVSVFFVDTKRQYKKNKVPIEIKCEVLNNVHIRIIDSYDNSILQDYDKDKNSTKLFYNGLDYDYDLFVPKMFKGKTISFEFVVVNEITSAIKVIKNNTKIKVL